MSVKVCHVTSVHPRYDTRIFHKECTSLAKAGYDVTLLVADNNAPEIRNGVKIIAADFRPASRLDRILHSSCVMFKYAMQVNAEIYHLHDPELLPVAKKLKQNGKKVIFDSHEDVPAQILNKHWIPKHLRKLCSDTYSIYSDMVLRKLDYIIGVTPHLVEKLRRINPNVEMITNFPLIVSHDDSEENAAAIKKNNVIAFAGGITSQWSHEIVLQAIENLDVQYILAGSSSEEYIKKLTQYPAWSKVNYVGKIPHEEVSNIFQHSTIGMAILQYSPNTNGKDGTLGNTKLFEYMMAGLPVICTDFTLWKEIVEKYQCGICVGPNDAKTIHNAIAYLIHNSQKAREMGKNGRKAVQKEFNWSIEERKLCQLYSSVWKDNK